jgi:nuclear transport factor 2 (NTF2) superfamily protein
MNEKTMESTGNQNPDVRWASDLLARAEHAFNARDKEAILELFSDDVHVVFADYPPMIGKAAYRKFLDARFNRQLEYDPRTKVRAVMGNVIGASWEATWIDAQTKVKMCGRGCEFVYVKDGKIVEFIVAFNAWNIDTGPNTPII